MVSSMYRCGEINWSKRVFVFAQTLVAAFVLSSQAVVAESPSNEDSAKNLLKRRGAASIADASPRAKIARARASRAPFDGGWNGRLVLRGSSCPNAFQSSFLFRHIIGTNSRGAVRIETSSDGTLSGRSRDKGRRLEVSRGYRTSNGLNVGVAIQYSNLRRNVADLRYAVSVSQGNTRCEATYSANSIRAF